MVKKLQQAYAGEAQNQIRPKNSKSKIGSASSPTLPTSNEQDFTQTVVMAILAKAEEDKEIDSCPDEDNFNLDCLLDSDSNIECYKGASVYSILLSLNHLQLQIFQFR